MKILIVYTKRNEFVKTDIDLLNSTHDVRELKVSYNGLESVRSVKEIISGVQWADVIFSWFGGPHALLPFMLARLIRRPRIVVASGFDVANLPEIQYGNMRPGFRRSIGILVFHLAQKILAVSDYTAGELKRNIPVNPNKIERVYHGFSIKNSSCASIKPRDQALTIGVVKENNLLRKGILTYVNAAKYLPEVRFSMVGPWVDNSIHELQVISPPNVQFTGFVQDLSSIFPLSKAYVQCSYHEAFGCSVAEAMLYGCVPVVSDRGALPEVVGETGFYVPVDDPRAVAEGIRLALESDEEWGCRARQRIVDLFPLEERARRLNEVLDEVYIERSGL